MVPSIIFIVLIMDYERSRINSGSIYLIFRSLFVSLITDLVSLLYIDLLIMPGEGWTCYYLGLPRTAFCYFNLL